MDWGPGDNPPPIGFGGGSGHNDDLPPSTFRFMVVAALVGLATLVGVTLLVKYYGG